LKQSQKAFEPIKKSRAAKKGDAVSIDFVGKIDGEPFEGGAANDFQLELGSGQFIPGFEEQLEGVKKKDEVVVKVSFPDEYGAKELAGKEAEFDVTVKDVLEAKEPEVNDEFAKKLGMESVDKLNEAIKEQIAQDFDMISRTKLKKDIFDAMDVEYKFEVPESMVEMEFKSIQESAENTEEAKNADEKEKKEQEKEFKELAERRVRLGVILADIGKKNAITVSEDELRKSVFEQARNYPGQEQKVIEFYQQNKEALDRLKGPILEDKVVDFVLDKVKLTEKKVTTEELLKFSQEEGA
jgi:trigger factor